MLVALTGTPGTGKTTVSKGLEALGHHVIDLGAFAAAHGLSEPIDDGEVLDLDAVALRLPVGVVETMVVEGHLSHLLPVDLTIVLRCNPDVLRQRLAGRGWLKEKVEENVEAEAVDVILLEALERCDDIREVDTTAVAPAELVETVADIVEGRDSGHRPGSVDWSDVILSWY